MFFAWHDSRSYGGSIERTDVFIVYIGGRGMYPCFGGLNWCWGPLMVTDLFSPFPSSIDTRQYVIQTTSTPPFDIIRIMTWRKSSTIKAAFQQEKSG